MLRLRNTIQAQHLLTTEALIAGLPSRRHLLPPQFTKAWLTPRELMEERGFKETIGRKQSFCEDIVKPFPSNNIVKMRRK